MALKEKTEKEITQYNMELKVNCCVLLMYVETEVFLGVWVCVVTFILIFSLISVVRS